MTQVADVQKDAEQARKQAMALDEKLKMTDAQRQAAETKVKGVGERLEAAGIKNDDPVKGVDQLAAARNNLKGTIDQAAKKLAEANLLPPGESAALLKGIEQAIKVAQASDPKGDLKKSQMEVANLKTALEQRRSPEEMLDVWLPVLAVRVPREAADRALADAAFVLSSRPEAAKAAKAQAVRGLALRATGDYDGARKALDQAVKQGATASASQALKALSDPNAFYAPRAHELMSAGRHAEAVELLTEAVAVFPKNNAGLLALRSLARLEGARVKGGGKVAADDPAIAEARRDAQAAAAAGAHEGHYAAGRIAEVLGNLKEAQDGYRRCLAAHPAKDDVGSRYRIALARVLLKSSSDRAAALSTDGAVAEAQPALASLVLLTQLTAQAGAGAAADEAARLADEVLESKEAPFLARAQALGMKGLWTKALQTYADGLRTSGRPDHADVLAEIIDQHPGLKKTESQPVANPLQAEGYYAQGQRAYWARRYADAEKAFAAAVEADGQDARHHYFLGLARLAQGNRQAYEDFEQGARLERLERPGRAAVSAALERLQGSARQTVNSFRP
jgi:tetratricopeptide (TPR) repeat protein